MKISNSQLKEALLKGNYIKESDLSEAITTSKKRNISLFNYLIESDLLNNDLIGQAIAESYKIPYADLNSNKPSKEQVLRIPEEVAKKLRLILFSEDKKEVIFTSDEINNVKIVAKIAKYFPKKKVKLAFSLTQDIDEILNDYFKKTLTTRFSQIIESQSKVAPEIITEIIKDALSFKASDIHFEPQEKTVEVRFRVDGVLQKAGNIPKEYYENIINRLKVQARLRIDEHFSTQDGSIHLNIEERSVDIRISIVPTIEGEKIVLRILAAYVQGFKLTNLGLSQKNQEILKINSKKPFGMILTTGPTGSGKSTTLYAILKMLNNPEINITTIEDPVEITMPGINQIQVNRQTDLTFAKGLRSIVRQDPDVILVGEIRDKETAEIAVNAALTGHLLLSTFHANDAATSIPRLVDMGIEPFLLSSTLELIIAQRLVRKVCESCRYSENLKPTEIEKKYPGLGKHFKRKLNTLYKGKGCPVCAKTGYNGRVGIFEFISVDTELKELIMKNPTSQQIQEMAKKQNNETMFEDGLEKVKLGITTLEELIRVANPPYDKKNKK